MAKLTVQLLTCVILCSLTQAGQDIKSCHIGPCKKGQYYNNMTASCTACPLGFYMDKDDHACPRCYSCTNPLPIMGEVVKEKCTATSGNVLFRDDNQKRETNKEGKLEEDDLDDPGVRKLTDSIPPFIIIGLLFIFGLYVCIPVVYRYRHTLRVFYKVRQRKTLDEVHPCK